MGKKELSKYGEMQNYSNRGEKWDLSSVIAFKNIY